MKIRTKKAVESEAVAHKQETIESLITQVFQLYSNLLLEEARRPWMKILGEQVDMTPGPMYLETSMPKCKKVLAILHGLHNLSLAHGFPE